jgi:ABC-2 type transport system permease protein
MGKTWVVFKREYLERVRSKWFLIATFLGPVFFGFIAVVPIVMAAKTKTSTQLANVIILDATGTELGNRVAKTLENNNPNSPAPRVRTIKAEQVVEAEATATADVIGRQAIGYVVLDANTIAGKELRYAGRNATSLLDVQSITSATRQSLLTMRLEGEGLNAQRVTMLTNVRLEAKTEKIDDRGKEKASGLTSLFFGYAISFLLYIMIAIYGQSIMRGVLEEKTNRVAEVVVASVKPDVLLAGKILGSGFVALTQVTAWIVMAVTMYFVRVPILKAFGAAPAMVGGSLKIPSIAPLVGIALVLLFIFGFIFYASLFAAVGSMVSNQEDIQGAATPVMMMLVSSIIFMQSVLLNPSSTLAQVVSLLPFSAPIMMPMRMAIVAVPWYEIIGSLVSVGLGCAAAIWLSARIYRVGLLMYGKRPTIKELTRWIRMA